MDERDFRLLMMGLRQPFASYEQMGRELRISGTAVKQRFARLESDAAFRGYRAIPAAPLLGRTSHGYFFQPRSVSTDLVQQVADTEDVVWAVEHHDGVVSVFTYERPGVPPQALFDAIGAPPTAKMDVRITARAQHEPVSPLDWRALRPLVADARRDFEDVAAVSGLGRKTVARHLHELWQKGCFALAPMLVEARSTGAILYHLILVADSEESVAAAGRGLGPRAQRFGWISKPPGGLFACYADSAAEAFDAVQTVSRQRGVQNVVFNIPKRHGFGQRNVERWIDEALQDWATARRISKRNPVASKTPS